MPSSGFTPYNAVVLLQKWTSWTCTEIVLKLINWTHDDYILEE